MAVTIKKLRKECISDPRINALMTCYDLESACSLNKGRVMSIEIYNTFNGNNKKYKYKYSWSRGKIVKPGHFS